MNVLEKIFIFPEIEPRICSLLRVTLIVFPRTWKILIIHYDFIFPLIEGKFLIFRTVFFHPQMNACFSRSKTSGQFRLVSPRFTTSLRNYLPTFLSEGFI
jgi:hypothetical protein